MIVGYDQICAQRADNWLCPDVCTKSCMVVEMGSLFLFTTDPFCYDEDVFFLASQDFGGKVDDEFPMHALLCVCVEVEFSLCTPIPLV